MAPGSLFAILGCINAFLATSLLLSNALRSADAVAHSLKVQQRIGAPSAVPSRLQEEVRQLVPVAQVFLRVRVVDRFASLLQRGCAAKGVSLAKEGILSLLSCVFAAILAFAALAGRPELGVALVACFLLAAPAWAKHQCDVQKEAMRACLPDALRSMSSCFGVGLTLQQTFAHLAKELKGPLRLLFAQASDEMQTGTSPDAALRHIKERGGIGELSFVAVALSVQHQTGGSMQRVLDAANDSLAQELELAQSLRVHTAQAKLSARVVSGVTVGLVVAMMLLSEDFLAPFLQSVPGMAMLATALGMQVAGVMCVRAFLNVEVD